MDTYIAYHKKGSELNDSIRSNLRDLHSNSKAISHYNPKTLINSYASKVDEIRKLHNPKNTNIITNKNESTTRDEFDRIYTLGVNDTAGPSIKKGVKIGGIGGLVVGGLTAAGGTSVYMHNRAKKTAQKIADDAAISHRLAIDKINNLKNGSGLGSVKSSLKSLGADAKDYIMNNPAKFGSITAGTIGAIGAGLAAKKYLSRRKK